MAKKYSVDVHYDFYFSVEVEAENESDAIDLACAEADVMPIDKAHFGYFNDACITDVEDIE